MTSNVEFKCGSPEPPPPKTKKICDCHKKLVQFGIPLYICEENDCYAEQPRAISYEKAFKLPGRLAIDDGITEYLKVEENDLPVVFEQMAEIFPNLRDYEENVLSFWILDVLIEGLWTAQNAKMDFAHQKATLMWIAYFINFIQEENPSRRQLFRHLKVVLFQNSNQCNEEGNAESLDECTKTITENFISTTTHWSLPLPPNAYRIPTKSQELLKEKFGEQGSSSPEEYHSEEGSNSISAVTSETQIEEDSDRNVSDMKIILEILYRIFARAFGYQHIQTVLNNMPSLELVELPFPMRIPKPLAKPETLGIVRSERSGKKISVSEKLNEEMETEKQMIKNNFILPLEVSEEAKEYLKQHSSDRSVLWRNKEDKSKK